MQDTPEALDCRSCHLKRWPNLGDTTTGLTLLEHCYRAEELAQTKQAARVGYTFASLLRMSYLDQN